MTSLAATQPLAPSGGLDMNNEEMKLRGTGFSLFNWNILCIKIFYRFFWLLYYICSLFVIDLKYINKPAFRTLPGCDKRLRPNLSEEAVDQHIVR